MTAVTTAHQVSASAQTPQVTPAAAAAAPPAQHSYGTRIRQNSVIKPSARLRQSDPDPPPPPRRIKPQPMPKLNTMHSNMPTTHNMPAFPPSHINLHPEDANSKVLLAIARSFLSVDNRAMTIKDLAEMTLNFGLVCQNVSAAGQAITTYIRNHMQRCETEGDHPLLLRHTLSGTSADDDLLPALHSRTGGAHCTVNPETRSTNFRRGTMVWYLSRATGSPCPFTRAGIRLCQYGENGKVGLSSGSRDRKRERDRQRREEQQCGQKRKRPLRGNRGSGSESADEGPKPKIKLTLRLKPRAVSNPSPSPSESLSSTSAHAADPSDSDDSSRDDSMSVDSSSDEEEVPEKAEVPWSLPPYPRKSIDIPCYTPIVENFSPFTSGSPSYFAGSPSQAFRRSPSIPFSVASPPPDSDDDDDDFNMTGMRHSPAHTRRIPAVDSDWDIDSDEEREEYATQFDSPGPRSPSAPLVHSNLDVFVKQEPRDVEGVQGMLDLWEPLDSNSEGSKVAEVIAKAAADMQKPPTVKIEELESWGWDDSYESDWFRPRPEDENKEIKQEELEVESALISGDESVTSAVGDDDYASPSPLSPTSGTFSMSGLSASAPSISTLRRHSELAWKDVELLGPDSVHLHEFEDGEWQPDQGSSTFRGRAKTQPSLPTFIADRDFRFASTSSQVCVSPPASEADDPVPSTARPSAPSPSVSSLTNPADAQAMIPSEPVIVHTCQPCTLAITATQVEGISVYQVILGAASLFRRIDTDFVNLTPITEYLGVALPSVPHSAVIVSHGSSIVCGTWVPLSFAQEFVRDCPLPSGVVDHFLSDALFELFPSALQDFHRTSAPGRLLNQFGPHFKSTVEAKRGSDSTIQGDIGFRAVRESWEKIPGWDIDDDGLLSSHPPISLALAALRQSPEEDVVPETPLSPTEQEMFHTLCGMPEWEKENVMACKETSPQGEEDAEDDTAPSRSRDHQPRRRSKRVAMAAAIATRPRTRSQKRNSHNSLS